MSYLESQYRIDRIDFVDMAKCYFCHRLLSSNISYIIEDFKGRQFCCGPSCLKDKAHISTLNIKFPDFTKASIAGIGEEILPDSDSLAPKKKRPASAAKDGFEEIEYLRLRCEKMGAFTGLAGPSQNALIGIYGKYRNGQVGEAELNHLRSWIKSVRSKHPMFTPENLATAYAFDFWLSVAIRRMRSEMKNEPAQFEKDMKVRRLLFCYGIRDFLRDRLYLTPQQISSMVEWSIRDYKMPELDPKAFSWSGSHQSAVKAS